MARSKTASSTGWARRYRRASTERKSRQLYGDVAYGNGTTCLSFVSSSPCTLYLRGIRHTLFVPTKEKGPFRTKGCSLFFFFFLPYIPPLSLLLPFLFLSLVAHLSPLRVPLSFLLSFLRARSVARALARDLSLSLDERVRERSKAGGRWWRIKSTRRSNNSCTTVTSVGTYAYMSVQARRTRSSPQRGKGSSYRKNAWYASCHFFVGGYFSFFQVCWFFDRAARGSVFAALLLFVVFVSTRSAIPPFHETLRRRKFRS